MTSLHILLEARSAVRRCWRAYEIEVGADLFGAWLVEMSYGRIGTMGRSKIRSFATAADAQAEVDAMPAQACERATTDRGRLSSAAASQAGDWSQPGLDDRLRAWFGGPDGPDHPNLALSQVQIGGTQPTIPPFDRADLICRVVRTAVSSNKSPRQFLFALHLPDRRSWTCSGRVCSDDDAPPPIRTFTNVMSPPCW